MDDERRGDFEAALEAAAAHAAGAVSTPPPPRAPTSPPTGGIPTRALLEQELFSDRIETGTAPPPEVTLSPQQLAHEGRAALKEGRFHDARVKLAEAIRLDPRDRYLRAAFHLASGYEARQQGREAEAADHFETARVFDKAGDEAIRELRRRR
jgi:tetratricopeptide (TPR) repeat protein